jgi:hypothetical protein
MFGFGKNIKELDQLIQSVKMNMENNYKDNAQSAFRELQETYYSRVLSDKQKAYYEPILSDLGKRLEGFSH